ncbi:MAG: 4Fe-4S binding protein [Candidatus Krumholzibacteria bacterium]|nr:4Fe-4S binding protein [Candidatus Krumholzibacteria bacterium]
MATEVFFHSLENVLEHELTPVDLRPGLTELVARLGLSGVAGPNSRWGLKVQLGAQGLPPSVDPAWARAVADALAVPGDADPARGSFCFDTLSITTGGLDKADTHLGMAEVKGYGAAGNGLSYLVADAPGQDDPLARVAGICLLSPVRPHPHAGFHGALTNLGVGLTDRPGKLLLHEDIRPVVNTPLCAGCGSCMTVCLFDAITLNAGRAFIDHEKCTGCGECMNVCFMAGISPEEAACIPVFQKKVAAAALTARDAVAGAKPGRAGFFNLLVRQDRRSGVARARGRERLGDVGVLASRDPVALDQATWDLIVNRMDGPLANWSGFMQEPGPLLERAQELELGSRGYRLVEV